MIEARYKNGVLYTCHRFDEIDFKAFVLQGLTSLRVDPFSYVPAKHGNLIRHFLRRAMKIGSQEVQSCYVLETDKWKIFVFEGGGLAILPDWDTSSVWTAPPSPEPIVGSQVNKPSPKLPKIEQRSTTKGVQP